VRINFVTLVALSLGDLHRDAMLPCMYEATVEEIEFHLATLTVDLRALFTMASVMSRAAWSPTVLPLLAHVTGVCLALESILDDEDARFVKALALAISSIQAPERNAETAPNEKAWGAIRAAHADLAKRFVGRGMKPWVLAGQG
jgi:hypothetical protein